MVRRHGQKEKEKGKGKGDSVERIGTADVLKIGDEEGGEGSDEEEERSDKGWRKRDQDERLRDAEEQEWKGKGFVVDGVSEEGNISSLLSFYCRIGGGTEI